MKTIHPKTWKGFEKAIESIRHDYGKHRVSLGKNKTYVKNVQILFRGQSNVNWELQTSLERKTETTMDVLKYVQMATSSVHEIESFIGKDWHIKSYPDLRKEIEDTQDSFRVHLPSYDYLVYLRHHGFPSPLLDWTESPYIAAYFAYLDNTAREDAAVYCYIERPENVKGGTGGIPMITVKGPYVTTHKRHFAQKAWYTVATKWDYTRKCHFFCQHENVFHRNNQRQDVLFKIVLPSRQRKEVLRHLDDYNINHFTLFQSEDALIRSIETKTFDIGT